MDIREIIQKTEEQIVASGLGEITRKDYLFHILNYLAWLKNNELCITDTGLEEVNQYISYKNDNSISKRKKQLKISTINSIKASLRFLYEKTLDKPEIASRIKGKKPPERIPITINEESLPKIFNYSKTFYKNDNYKNHRAYYLITFLYQSGARISEALNAKVDDINFKENTIKLFGKNYEYLRKLDPEWLKEFKHWLQINSIKQHLFVNQDGGRMPKRTAQWIVTETTGRVLGKSYSPHKFRASCITHRLKQGEEFFQVSSNFHNNPNTTKKYIGASGRNLKNMKNPFTELKKEKDMGGIDE